MSIYCDCNFPHGQPSPLTIVAHGVGRSIHWSSYQMITKHVSRCRSVCAACLSLTGACCVQLVIDSPVSPATSIAPLIFVVVITAIKQVTAK